VNGILNVLKPPGKTSFQVVSLIRKLSGERRVGHAGTLDPQATGVLLLCLGQATKVVQFLSEATKVYHAEIELGIITDTWDSSGRVIQREEPSSVSKAQLEKVLPSLLGTIEQTPPMYSAIRYKGRRLYELARQGIEVERKRREVHLFRLELLEWQPPLFTIEVECSGGTYIRSLAYDIGQSLGCGACLKELVRLKCGSFSLEEAIDPSSIEEAFHYGYWQSLLYPVDEALLNWDALILGREKEETIKKGLPVPLVSQEGCPDRCRAYSLEGRFLAILRSSREKIIWHPDKVFLSTS